MGPLLAHIEIQSNSGTGFDPLGNGAVLNAGYVQWQARLVLRLSRRRRHLEGLLLARPQRHAGQSAGLYRQLWRRRLGHAVAGAERVGLRL
jgi:hypothetical protein